MRSSSLICAAAVVLLAGCGGTVEPVQPTVAARTQTAARAQPAGRSPEQRLRGALMTRDDLGDAWVRDDTPPRRVHCGAIDPWHDARLTQGTPIFRSQYVAVQQFGAMFDDAGAATRAAHALASAPAQRCLRRALVKEAADRTPAADFHPVEVVRADTPEPGIEATRLVTRTTGGRPPGGIYIDEIRSYGDRYLIDTAIITSARPLDEQNYNAIIAIVADHIRKATT